jgi:hypothetical protein
MNDEGVGRRQETKSVTGVREGRKKKRLEWGGRERGGGLLREEGERKRHIKEVCV